MADKPDSKKSVEEKSERARKEESILEFWKQNKIFEKSLNKDAPKGDFVFYDGPPFATGLPHYGHILPGTMKDVIPRYKTMCGFKVARRWGWDCHGLPIENLIEKELGLETKKDIEKFGIGQFNKRAKASVLRFEKDWKEIIPRTGRWVDMENSYKTMDPSYTESVWWSFKNLYDRGLIYQGFKSMHLCPHCETTLSNFEVNQGYKDVADLSVVAKFELIDRPKTFVLAWTTTPWTLPGNVALAVNPEIEYAEVEGEVDGETYVLALSRVETVFGEKARVVRKISNQELVGLSYKSLFDYYQNEGRIFAAGFVTTEEGTGVVHIAPAFGEEDYELSLRENLPFIQHVGMDGRFKPEVKDFAGEKVKPKDDPQATDVKIIKYLAAKNLLFKKEKVVHSYPHCWRCDTPLLNYASYSWFVKVSEIRDKLISRNKKVKWVPEDIRDGRFGKWLEGARDWAISRTRFWGTPLPVWQNEDGSKRIVVDSLETLKKYGKKSGNKYFLMRHGQSKSNVLEIVSGKADVPHHLTEKGRKDVQASAERLRQEKIDLIISSPFVRTRETALIVANTFGFAEDSIVFDNRLEEIDTGVFEGGPLSAYRNAFATYEERYDNQPEGGESLSDLKLRTAKFLQELEESHEGKNILIVTHEYVAWMLTAAAGGLSRGEAIALKKKDDFIETAGVMEIIYENLPRDEQLELDLHRPYIDEFLLIKDGEEYRRVPEVFDTWYDSGSVPFASRRSNDSRPADFIAEGLDQTRGWFYTLAVLGTTLFGDIPYRHVIVNGLVLAEDGKKMSKRLKNYPELSYVLDKYGADALRYYLVSSPAVRAEDLAFSEKGLDEVVKKIVNRLDNAVNFYELYAGKNYDGLEEHSSTHILDLWIDARLNELIGEVTQNLEKYTLDRASRPLAGFVDDLSTWYLRRSRTRVEALPKLREVLIEFSKVLAPFMPFLAEDIYLRLRGSLDVESVHLFDWPVKDAPDKEVLEKMESVREIASEVLMARNTNSIKVRQPLALLKIRDERLKDAPEYLELIKDEVNVKEIIFDSSIGNNFWLDTTLTPGLEEEGRLRDAIRIIQDWRKERGLKPSDTVRYDVPPGLLELFTKYANEIKKTTNIEFS